MVQVRVPALALLLLLVPAQAGVLEEASDGAIAYQFDGDTHHDAPDSCAAADPAWNVTLGSSTDGMVVAGEDESDAFVLDIPASAVGSRVHVRATPPPGGELDVTTWAPSCLGDILDPANLPTPHPQPPQPPAGHATFTVGNLAGSWTCNPSEWHFVINGLGSAPAPASIHVAWTDGTEVDLALASSNAGTGHYVAASPLTVTLKGAWANLPSGWSGNFLVSHAPCSLQDGGAIYGDPPRLLGNLLDFTPVRSGEHVVVVTLAHPDPEPGAPTAVPASCHYCFAPAEAILRALEYRLSALSQ